MSKEELRPIRYRKTCVKKQTEINLNIISKEIAERRRRNERILRYGPKTKFVNYILNDGLSIEEATQKVIEEFPILKEKADVFKLWEKDTNGEETEKRDEEAKEDKAGDGER